MRRICTIAGILATLLATPCTGTEPGGAKIWRPLQPGARPRVVVPGGYTRQAPANTARPLVMASEDGLDCVELEVRRTKDGQHVVFDADQIEGKTSGTGMVRDYTLAELQSLDAGNWFAKRFAGAKVLSLAEALNLAKDRIHLLLVCQDVEPEQLVREVTAAGLSDQVAVSAAADNYEQISKAAAGKIAIVGRPVAGEDLTSWAARTKPDAVLLPADLATADACLALHKLQITVMADACGDQDNSGNWEKLLSAGVDAVRSDVPEEFLVFAIARRVGKRPVQIAAHRGQLRYAPENTAASLEKAARMQADFVEIDVHTTSDGAFLSVARRHARSDHRRPRPGSASHLRQRCAGWTPASWFGQPFVGALGAGAGRSTWRDSRRTMGLYFDAKDITPEALAAAVAKHGLVERTVVYQGPVYLEKLKQIDPRIRLRWRRSGPQAMSTPWPSAGALRRRYAVETLVARLHRTLPRAGHQGLFRRQGRYDRRRICQAIDWGIDLIQTDHPLRLWRAIEQRFDNQ